MGTVRKPKQYRQREMLALKGYITAAEAAKLAGMSIYSIYRWIESERVKSMTVQKARYVLRKSLLDYLGPDLVRTLGLDTQPPGGAT